METSGQGAWCNIVVAPNDGEVAAIDRMKRDLGTIPKEVMKVRELITRFEACHFKYKQHYHHILESIAALHPVVDVERIGAFHIRHDGDAWKEDTTGRSKIGIRYISALRSWLGEDRSDDVGVRHRVDAALGERSDEKERLVRLLLDRLLDRNLEDHFSGGMPSGLKLQALSTDICHYAFPQNLEQLLEGIGRLKPVSDYEGCGSVNDEVTSFMRTEVDKLSVWLASDDLDEDLGLGDRTPVKAWLVACLAKTLKQHVQLDEPLPGLGH